MTTSRKCVWREPGSLLWANPCSAVWGDLCASPPADPPDVGLRRRPERGALCSEESVATLLPTLTPKTRDWIKNQRASWCNG